MAPPSTITMALAEPATTMSTSAYSSCVKVGFTTQLPWMRPIRTDATGVVRKGMTEVFSATEAPMSVEDVGVVLLVGASAPGRGSGSR